MTVPLKDIFKNKLLLQENFHTQEISMDDWPFWMFEEKIKIANEIIEDKEKARRKQEESQKHQMPNMNHSQYTNSMNSLMNKFKN